MITFIICSIEPERAIALKANIEQTSGIQPQVFIHDNRILNWGLCRVYNHYSALASCDVICYLHEDVTFLTQNWAVKILDFYAQNSDAGVIGFLGSQIKTKSPSAVGSDPHYEMGSLLQRTTTDTVKSYMQKAGSSDFSQVIPIDGLCMIAPRKVWDEVRFDEARFDKFHLYDLDFTIGVAQHYKNYVCHSVVVEHGSEGSHNEEWYKYTKIFQDKWGERLPMTSIEMTKRQIRHCEHYAAYKFFKNILKSNHLTKRVSPHTRFAASQYALQHTWLSNIRLMRYRI